MANRHRKKSRGTVPKPSRRQHSSYIVRTPQENSLLIRETSKETRIMTTEMTSKPKDCSVSLKMRRAGKLKQAIGALIDSHFNPKGFGLIDVDRKGVEITVWNIKTRVIGNLRMQPSYRKGFHYSKPFVSKMVNLNRVYDNLAPAIDDEQVTIYYVHGSNELFFKFGSNQITEFSVELVEPDAEFEKLPAIKLARAAAVPSKHLRQMIPLMVQEGTPQRVVVSTSHKNVIITVGDKEWQYNVEDGETRVWKRQELQDEFNAWFQWPHCESLMKASRLSKLFSLCFIDDPRDCFMFRFIDHECCDLAYIKHYDDFTEPSSSKGNENPTDRSLEQNPYVFKFQLHPAGALKNALQSMTDYDFNGLAGLGMIEVSKFGVDIRVCNSKTGVIGLLHLFKTGLINFKCNNPFSKRMVNLDSIALNILLAHDNDFIAVHQVDESNEISFKYGHHHHLRAFPAELQEKMVDGFEEFPYEYDITYACQIMLPTELLREVIHKTMGKNRKPEIASVETKTDGYFSISVGELEWVCEDVTKLFGSDASNLPVQNHKVCFEWCHLESINWASFLADWFIFCILTDPPDNIVMRFKLHDLGYLHYMKKLSPGFPTLKMSRNSERVNSFTYK